MTRGIPGSLTHGHSGYRNGCRCDVCVTGHRAYARERYRAQSGHAYVDAAPFVAVFSDLYRRGEDVRHMAEVTGLDEGTVRALVMGERTHVIQRTADAARRVLALLPGETT